MLYVLFHTLLEIMGVLSLIALSVWALVEWAKREPVVAHMDVNTHSSDRVVLYPTDEKRQKHKSTCETWVQVDHVQGEQHYKTRDGVFFMHCN